MNVSRGSVHRALLLALALSGCGEEPVMTVGPVGFGPGDLLGLSDAALGQLGAITAVGIAFSRGEEEALTAPLAERELDDLRVARLREAILLEAAGIGDAELEARYTLDPEPELVVRHLVLLSERWRPAEHRAAARARAEEALRAIRDGRPFPEVAAEYSEEPGAAERGGLLEPGREGSWVRSFWEAARALEPGQVSEVVESEYGFHVLHLDARRAVPFPEARDRFAARVVAGFSDSSAWDAFRAQRLVAEGAVPAGLDPETHTRNVLVTAAHERGIELSEADVRPVREGWARRAAGWAGALGFRERMEPHELAEQALRALGRTDQEARLARDAITTHLEVLAAGYPVRRDLH